MEFWVLTPYLGTAADEQRTVSPWGLVELPRRPVFVGVIASFVWALVVVAPLNSLIAPYNWVVGAALVAATVWVFTARTQGTGVRQYRHMLDLAKAKVNKPIYAGGGADTRSDDVRFLVQSWTFPNQPPVTGSASVTADMFGWAPAGAAQQLLRAPDRVDVSKLKPMSWESLLS